MCAINNCRYRSNLKQSRLDNENYFLKLGTKVTFRNSFAEKLGGLFDEQETALQQQNTRKSGVSASLTGN